MRPLLRATLAGLATATATAGSARAQGPDGFLGPPLATIASPAFSSPLGGGQGYGYAPSAGWPRPGLQLGIYYDGTVSSPYRPGSLNTTYPLYGYFPTGEGPYVFPPRRPR